MKSEDLEKLRENMTKKLGEDNMALISDDFSTIMLDNNDMNTQIATKDEEITRLKQDKETLINTNGNLLQKISMESKEERRKNEREDTEKENKKYSLSNAFDENGNFK